MSAPARSRRAYDATLRRRQAAATRERILDAGCELLHGSSIRDWRALTLRAVAERAGVSERTVYRHFASERRLRDAVMHHLEQQAGIDLAGMRLRDVADVTARIFEHVASYPREERPPLDPTLSEAAERQRTALLAAVAEATPRWRAADRVRVAALLDVLWSVASYERLVVDWHLDRRRAVAGMTWLVRLVEQAIASGRRPVDRLVPPPRSDHRRVSRTRENGIVPKRDS